MKLPAESVYFIFIFFSYCSVRICVASFGMIYLMAFTFDFFYCMAGNILAILP